MQMKSKEFFQDFESPELTSEIIKNLQYKKQFNQYDKIVKFIFALPFLVFIDAIFYPISVWQRFCIAYEKSIIKELKERIENA